MGTDDIIFLLYAGLICHFKSSIVRDGIGNDKNFQYSLRFVGDGSESIGFWSDDFWTNKSLNETLRESKLKAMDILI